MSGVPAGPLVAPRVRRPHYLRTVAAVVVVLLVAFWVQGLARNRSLQWSVVGHYLFDGSVLEGLKRTIIITVISIVIAVVLGTLLANMRLSKNPVLRGASWFYIWFFRSIPLLVLLIIAYNFSLLYPRLGLGVPFGGEWFSFNTQKTIDPLAASIVAFGLQQAAYTSEVLRAAIQSVPAGQREAAFALGMTHPRTMLRIVFPQALRVAVPPVANETINLLKSTSLVAFISVPDLLYSVQQIYSTTFQVMPLLVVASLWYMFIVSLLSAGQYFVEKRLGTSPGTAARRPARVIDGVEGVVPA